jgi:hypothetical protein
MQRRERELEKVRRTRRTPLVIGEYWEERMRVKKEEVEEKRMKIKEIQVLLYAILIPFCSGCHPFTRE